MQLRRQEAPPRRPGPPRRQIGHCSWFRSLRPVTGGRPLLAAQVERLVERLGAGHRGEHVDVVHVRAAQRAQRGRGPRFAIDITAAADRPIRNKGHHSHEAPVFPPVPASNEAGRAWISMPSARLALAGDAHPGTRPVSGVSTWRSASAVIVRMPSLSADRSISPAMRQCVI